MPRKRADGRRIKNISPFLRLVPYIMNRRIGAHNETTIDIEVGGMRKFIAACRERDIPMSYMVILIAAYIRTLAEHPILNRFVVNKRIYARNHICVSFVILREYEESNVDETIVKVYFDPADDIYAVSQKINAAIAKNREAQPGDRIDRLVHRIMHISPLVTVIVGAIKLMDRLGCLPRSILEISPFHSSIFITNMASLRMPHIYHHLYEFGTASVFLAIGRLEYTFRGTNKIQVMPLGFVTDERICPGSVYARCLKTMQRYMKNPALLAEKAKIVREDVE